jgi:hypothetical protein
MGTEFRANADLTITHIRVYSGATPAARPGRLGRIWSLAGLVLGQATMPTNLPAGWQLYALDVPVARLTGESFIVTFDTSGNYAATAAAFDIAHNSADGALTARKSSEALNGNGVFNTVVGSFPSSSFSNTFYGIDVGYDLGISGNTRPVITSLALTTPGDGFTVGATITATDAETLVGATYLIEWGDGATTAAASGSHTYASSGLKAVLGSVTDAGGLADFAAAAIALTPPADGTLAGLRTSVAAALTTALAGVPAPIYESQPEPLRAGSGWLQVKAFDTEDITYGETARVTYDVVIALGVDRLLAETQLDKIAGPMLEACSLIGRGVSVKPFTINIGGTDFYCAVATLITEG